MRRQFGHLELVDRADPRDLGIVVDGEGAVGSEAHIELDAVGAQSPGLGESLDGVLGESVRATPMGKDGSHWTPVIFPSRFHREGA